DHQRDAGRGGTHPHRRTATLPPAGWRGERGRGAARCPHEGDRQQIAAPPDRPPQGNGRRTRVRHRRGRPLRRVEHGTRSMKTIEPQRRRGREDRKEGKNICLLPFFASFAFSASLRFSPVSLSQEGEYL